MRFMKLLPWLLLFAALAFIGYRDYYPASPASPATLLSERPAAAIAGEGPVSYATAVNAAAPAVVNIYTTQALAQPNNPWMNDPLFRRFFGQEEAPSERMASSLGSGVIISPEGYILTNNHVVASATEILVALRDGREAKAAVIGADPDTDLAVIKIDLPELPVLPFKTSTSAVGDVVLAIGNPFGVGQTVTQGIISAIGRQGLGINTYEDFIQTDAAINPGNSGGALVDVNGNLVGINSAIYSRSGGNMGIGFAIPSTLAREVMTAIIQQGKVVRGWLGVEVRELDEGLAQHIGSQQKKGVIIASIMRGGPAQDAGIKPGDVLISVNQVKTQSPAQVINQIAALKPGSRVPFTVERQGKLYDLQVGIGERPVQDSTGRD